MRALNSKRGRECFRINQIGNANLFLGKICSSLAPVTSNLGSLHSLGVLRFLGEEGIQGETGSLSFTTCGEKMQQTRPLSGAGLKTMSSDIDISNSTFFD